MSYEDVRIHDSASVSDGAEIGKGTVIWQYCIVQDGVCIGEHCSLGANVFLERGVALGSGVKVKNNIALYTGVICEDDVFLGPNCVFTNVINPRSFISRKSEFKGTVVKRGATIGANSTVICGHTIGRYAMVGAGSVVTKDIPDYALAVGNPARLKGYVCECGCTLRREEERYLCPQCGTAYHLENNNLIKG